jgi:hypothetical protein
VNGYKIFLEDIPVIGLVLKLPSEKKILSSTMARNRFFPLTKKIMKHLLMLGKGL